MADKLEFYFDFVSPYSYLANTQIGRLADRVGVDIVYRPVALLELMKLVGNRPTTVECKNKQKYAGADIRRWAAKYGVRMQPNPHFAAIDKPRLCQYRTCKAARPASESIRGQDRQLAGDCVRHAYFAILRLYGPSEASFDRSWSQATSRWWSDARRSAQVADAYASLDLRASGTA